MSRRDNFNLAVAVLGAMFWSLLAATLSSAQVLPTIAVMVGNSDPAIRGDFMQTAMV